MPRDGWRDGLDRPWQCGAYVVCLHGRVDVHWGWQRARVGADLDCRHARARVGTSVVLDERGQARASHPRREPSIVALC